MSIQTVTDIIVNQQVKTSDLQKSAQNQLSSQKSKTSFSELISIYQKESDDKSVKTENNMEKNIQESEKTENDESSSVESKSSSASVSEKEEIQENQKLENTSEKKDTKVEEKNISEEKPNVKSESKSSKKSDSSMKIEEKADGKNFNLENTSRIDELLAASVEPVQIEVSKNQKTEKNEVPEIDVKAEGIQENLQLVSENLVSIADSVKESEDLEKEDLGNKFDFGQKKSEKTVNLDKEGKITVEDLRTKKEDLENVSDKNETKLKTELKIDNENTATITMDYVQTVESDVLSLNNQTAASNGSTYQQMLNNQIQNNVPEFVKAGNIVLKDNNQGTINLVLHPDDLGNVKIHLSLDGKTITGHITVASKEALEVFKDNAETLREAFIKSGFDAADFNVAYGGNQSGFGETDDFQRNDGRELFGRRAYGEVAVVDEDLSDEFINNSKISDNFSINIVA